jgi:phosphatidylglycerol:prolipoprotein diacylglycerol transferase
VELGPFELRWYALFIICGIIAGMLVARSVARWRGQNEAFLLDSVPIVILFAVVGARLYYILLEWSHFRDYPGEIISIQMRGLTIHGALVGGVLAFWYLCRIHGEPFFKWADTVIVGVPVGQAIGRLGNWANQEAFGRPTDLPWAVTIDRANRPETYLDISGFHPTFLYEALCSLAIAAALYWLIRKHAARVEWRDGYALASYLVLYGIVRFAIESLRTDSLYIGPWPAAWWLSLALMAAGAALSLVRWRVPTRVDTD